jgi:hypothetical protein
MCESGANRMRFIRDIHFVCVYYCLTIVIKDVRIYGAEAGHV